MDFWDQHKTITCFYEKAGEEVCKKYDISQMEYDILMFIDANPQYATAADIVRVRKSAKSHVSTSLKRLEEKGYIERKADEKRNRAARNGQLRSGNRIGSGKDSDRRGWNQHLRAAENK